MTKKINIRKVDGGVIMNIEMNIDGESKTSTDVYVFSDYIYGEKRDKFHTPAGNKIFDQMNNFKIVKKWGECLTCDVEQCPNGYYVTIKKDKKIVYEFVEDIIPFTGDQHFRDKLNCKLFEVISNLVNVHFATSLRNTNGSVLEFEIKN